MNIKAIIEFIDNYLIRTDRESIDPVEANALLDKEGLLPDSEDRPGMPLRKLLRKGQIPHAYQAGGKSSRWIIPQSEKKVSGSSNYPSSGNIVQKIRADEEIKKDSRFTPNVPIVVQELKKQLDSARLKYKPEKVKYLLIAEAPPESVDRFFYYEDVHKHDDLFLGVAQALYPVLKNNFIKSGRNKEKKKSILLKLKADGFYLLDLSDLPLSLLKESLSSQLPLLKEKINQVEDKNTKIILIKAPVFDIAFSYLKQNGFRNLVEIRIPFPGQRWQVKFQEKFIQAMKLVNYDGER